MGYSCTQDAQSSLAVISKFYATAGNSNILTIKGRLYFFERGREQADGAITGTLMLDLENGYCQKAGNVRIAPDGSIVRFPVMSKVDKEECENTFRELRARN